MLGNFRCEGWSKTALFQSSLAIDIFHMRQYFCCQAVSQFNIVGELVQTMLAHYWYLQISLWSFIEERSIGPLVTYDSITIEANTSFPLFWSKITFSFGYYRV